MAVARTRQRRRQKRTDDWTEDFFAAVREGYGVLHAAEQARISRATAYARAAKDPEFAAAFNEAREYAAEALEREAHRRALDPKARADWVLWQMLKAMKPEKYREDYRPPPITFDEAQLGTFVHAVQQAIEAAGLDASQDREFRRALESHLKSLEEPSLTSTAVDVVEAGVSRPKRNQRED